MKNADNVDGCKESCYVIGRIVIKPPEEPYENKYEVVYGTYNDQYEPLDEEREYFKTLKDVRDWLKAWYTV